MDFFPSSIRQLVNLDTRAAEFRVRANRLLCNQFSGIVHIFEIVDAD
jgi:hypothetical protein